MQTAAHQAGAVSRALVVCMLAALASLAAPAVPAHAWSEGACPDDEGITVVVDFRSLGGDTIVRCAPAPVESGYDALSRVGLDWTPTQRHPGFLCRIEGVPADDPCVNTPPADAYWAYWRAEPGGQWAYSNYGPATTSPPPGPVEGWSFSTGSDDQQPRIPPPGSAAAEPSPSPTTADPDPSPPDPAPEPTPAPDPPPPTTAPPNPPPAQPTTPAAASPAPVVSDEPSSNDPTPTPTPSASPTPTPSPSPTATRSASPTPSPSPTAEVATAAAESDDGMPISTLVAVALVIGLGTSAAVTSRRRRP